MPCLEAASTARVDDALARPPESVWVSFGDLGMVSNLSCGAGCGVGISRSCGCTQSRTIYHGGCGCRAVHSAAAHAAGRPRPQRPRSMGWGVAVACILRVQEVCACVLLSAVFVGWCVASLHCSSRRLLWLRDQSRGGLLQKWLSGLFVSGCAAATARLLADYGS